VSHNCSWHQRWIQYHQKNWIFIMEEFCSLVSKSRCHQKKVISVPRTLQNRCPEGRFDFRSQVFTMENPSPLSARLVTLSSIATLFYSVLSHTSKYLGKLLLMFILQVKRQECVRLAHDYRKSKMNKKRNHAYLI
jgi:hypothetical protein